MKRRSYKVEFFPLEEVVTEKQVDKERVEATLNRYARRGWRLAQVSICGQLGLICIFEEETETD